MLTDVKVGLILEKHFSINNIKCIVSDYKPSLFFQL